MNYQLHYNNLINRARIRILDEYTETHHIVPRCIGGSDDKNNLVELTPEEHYVAHQMLIKIYPTEIKLILAARYMCYGNSKNGGRKNNKLFGWLRRKHSIAMSILNTGRTQLPETIEKRKESRKWYKPSIETKEKISKSNQGKHKKSHSVETKKKISDTMVQQYIDGERISYVKGTHISDEHKAAISAAGKGKTLSDDHKKKISDAKIGVKFSEEHKQLLSKSSARKGKEPWNKGIPLSDDHKKTMGKKNSDNLKGKTWEEIYGIEGAAIRCENIKLKRMAKVDADERATKNLIKEDISEIKRILFH